ncbi:type VII secretion target [Actinomycetospora sp. NBRC 106378]|uniref:type VII secretion target n=1 Tax=Actinomycetospora sp. NBRC 106378 TaxID=3032208 RepID=UPI0024A09A31|nr:type VII secretion target [Actinomycetospora sp. NBRC 106378]GLZ51328.1 hypothetical protein Acsp07_09450 [Actinomycetospora sp. NBRC 106378]
MPDGFDVRPDQLRAGASALRGDVSGVNAARGRAGAAAQSAAGGSGEGPLAHAANELSSQLDKAVDAIERSVTATAAAIEAAAGNYQTSDAAASRSIGGSIPGF